jgi:hypothetical protein
MSAPSGEDVSSLMLPLPRFNRRIVPPFITLSVSNFVRVCPTMFRIGKRHLRRYVCEFDFRYNNRDISDAERTAVALRGIEGKRLLYTRF